MATIVFCANNVQVRAAENTMKNGAQFVSTPLRMAPYISISVLVKASVIDETPANAAWRQLLADAMIRSTKIGETTLQGAKLRQVAEDAGGGVKAQVFEDAIGFTITGDSAQQKELAELLLNIVMHPRLSQEDVAASRRAMLRRLMPNLTNSILDHSAATNKLQSQLYRDVTNAVAYGLPAGGTVDSISGLTDDALRRLYQRFFVASNMTISASGDVDEATLKEIFTQIPQGENVPQPVLNYAAPQKIGSAQMPVDTPWIFKGYRIDSHISGAELAALRVLTAALVENSPSILSKVLLTPRNDKGDALATSVSGVLTMRRYGSELMIAAQSDTGHISSAQNAITNAISELKSNPLTPAQLQAAIAYAEGDWASSRDGEANRSVLNGYNAVQGIPVNNWPKMLRTVNANDVQNVAKKYLNASNSSVVTVSAVAKRP